MHLRDPPALLVALLAVLMEVHLVAPDLASVHLPDLAELEDRPTAPTVHHPSVLVLPLCLSLSTNRELLLESSNIGETKTNP